MDFLYLVLLSAFIYGCQSNQFYRTQQDQTDKLLVQGKFDEALTSDKDKLISNFDGAEGLRDVYRESSRFKKEYPQILLYKIATAINKHEITIVMNEVDNLKKSNILNQDVYLNIEKNLIEAIYQGNLNGQFPFSLTERDDLPYLSDKKNSELIFKRAIRQIETNTGDRKNHFENLTQYVDYNSDNPAVAEYIIRHSIKMRLSPNEYSEYFSSYIPNLKARLSKQPKIQILLKTRNVDNNFKDIIDRTINESSYLISTIEKPDKDTFKLTITKRYIKSFVKNTITSESKAMPRLGTSAISGIIMAIKGVSGHNSTLVYNVNNKQMNTSYSFNVCLKTPVKKKECIQVKDFIKTNKKTCHNPRLIRDNGQIIKIDHYPIAGIENRCANEKQKVLKLEMYASLADKIADKLNEFKAVKDYLGKFNK